MPGQVGPDEADEVDEGWDLAPRRPGDPLLKHPYGRLVLDVQDETQLLLQH